jgi:poly(A) polymerase
MIRADAYLIARVSGERIRDEFLAILSQDGARAQLEVLDRLDLLCRIIPELADTKGVEQPSQHYWDVWGHLLHTVETAELVLKGHQHSAIYTLVPWKAETEAYFNEEASDGHSRRTLLKLAGLLHDIAKPQTKKRDETGRTRFLGHSVLGATHSAILLNRLRLSTRGNGMVTKMVEQHLRPTSLRQGIQLPTSRAIYRYFRDLDDVAIDTLYLCLADYLAAKGPNLVLEDWADHARMVSHVLLVGTQQASHAKPRRLLTGHDLMERYGLIPGPKMGSVLEKVREARATGEITTQEEAFALVTDTLNSHSGQE